MSGAEVSIHETACVESSDIGDGTRIWHFCHVMSGARLGRACSLGQNVFIATGVVVGNGVKIQNNVSLYSGTTVEDHVFIGPSCVLTNVSNPRAQIERKHQFERTLLRRGCTLGANATVLCGLTIGRYAMVGAGAVATRSVADYALVVGTPARQVGWVSRHAQRLTEADEHGVMRCPESGYRYRLVDGRLRCLDLDEQQALPPEQAVGRVSYRELRPLPDSD